MPFSAGDKLGPYQILAPIGAGGMGEAWKAHDPRLNRDVAIKVSAAQFTERFTREARAIAALNHTNICQLYDVGPNYLVMEYVEGPDLRGPLDFDDALPIIQQLIDGIEAAHEKNIIHRDLKPANINITPDGVVKILDFELAKALEPPPSEEALRVTERFRRRDFGHLDWEMTFDDPKLYTRPFTIKVPYELMADADIFEMFCENEKDSVHLPKQ